ncbi:hypothetical protein DFQ26_004149 [Actinomortierella ambigua]|nr:hypothetical protein DFQ26_004149 [Actinomortierella ambigua]
MNSHLCTPAKRHHPALDVPEVLLHVLQYLLWPDMASLMTDDLPNGLPFGFWYPLLTCRHWYIVGSHAGFRTVTYSQLARATDDKSASKMLARCHRLHLKFPPANGLSRQLTLLKLVFHPNRRKQIPLFYLLTNEKRPTLPAELASYPRALYELPLPHLKHLFISNAQVSPTPPSWSPDQMLRLTTFRLESSVGVSTLCDNPPAPDTVPEEMVAKMSRFALYKVRKPWMAFTHSLTRLEIVGEYRGSTMMPTMLHRFLCSEGARQLQELYLSGIEYYSPVLNPALHSTPMQHVSSESHEVFVALS